MKELARIEIPNYIRTVLMSKSRQKKYYVKGKKSVPKKYLTNQFIWKKRGTKDCLYNTISKEFVIANPKTHGTEKIKIINGQKIYNGEIQRWDRAKLMDTIHKSFIPYICKLKAIKEFPIKIYCEVHDLVDDPLLKNQVWDLENRVFPYFKGFHDVLKHQGIIPDDNILYITQPTAARFIPIEEGQERKLVFIIEKETDERVLNHSKYKK